MGVKSLTTYSTRPDVVTCSRSGPLHPYVRAKPNCAGVEHILFLLNFNQRFAHAVVSLELIQTSCSSRSVFAHPFTDRLLHVLMNSCDKVVAASPLRYVTSTRRCELPSRLECRNTTRVQQNIQRLVSALLCLPKVEFHPSTSFYRIKNLLQLQRMFGGCNLQFNLSSLLTQAYIK